MSDAEEDRYEGTSFSRTVEEEEIQEGQGGTRHDSGRKHGKQRRRREEEEDEGGEDEDDDEDEDDEDEDDDDEEDDEDVARGSKRQKVSCPPSLLGCLPPILKVSTSAATNAQLLIASLM